MNSPNCPTCSGRFGLFKRRKICIYCKNYFCSDCLIKEGKIKWCQPCRVLVRTPYDKEALSKLSVKELRLFLHRKHVSTVGCSEKKDLVDLVQENFGRGALNRAASSDRSMPSRSGTGGRSHSSPRVASDGRPSRSSEEPMDDDVSGSSSDEETPAPRPSSSVFDDGIRVRASDGHGQEEMAVEDDEGVQNSRRDGDQQRRASGSPSFSSSLPGAPDGIPMHEDSRQPPSAQVRRPAEEQVDPEPTGPANPPVGGGKLGRFPSVSDLASLDAVDTLSVRECKELLALYRVDFKGICEKEDLLAKVRELWIERQHAKIEAANLPDEELCRICMDSKIDCVLLDCGHMVTCTLCGKKMNECPICRQYVLRVVHVFRA